MKSYEKTFWGNNLTQLTSHIVHMHGHVPNQNRRMPRFNNGIPPFSLKKAVDAMTTVQVRAPRVLVPKPVLLCSRANLGDRPVRPTWLGMSHV